MYITMHNSLILVGKELRDTEGIFCLLLDLFSVMTHSVSGEREGERGREGKMEREGDRVGEREGDREGEVEREV